MSLLNSLIDTLSRKNQPALGLPPTIDSYSQPRRPQMTPRPQAETRAAPFRMFEDGSFQGSPTEFLKSNPSYLFFEDNSFKAPRPPSRSSRINKSRLPKF